MEVLALSHAADAGNPVPVDALVANNPSSSNPQSRNPSFRLAPESTPSDDGPAANRLSVVVVAAGRSTRMGDTDKTFAILLDAPLIVHTLRRLAAAEVVERIVLVAAAESMARARSVIADYAVPKIAAVCAGGARRQDSVYAGLQRLAGCRWVAVHDGARPGVRPELLDSGLAAAQRWGAAIAAVPVKDTIKVVGADGLIADTPPRAALWAAQTPQIFDYGLLLAAHENAAADYTAGDYTDDAAMLEAMGRPVAVFPGAYDNLKVTTPEDLAIAEQILAAGIPAA